MHICLEKSGSILGFSPVLSPLFAEFLRRRFMPVICGAFACMFLTCSLSYAQSSGAVTYDKVLELLQLEVKEEKLLKLLKDQPTVFTLSDGQIADLKKAGATDSLLSAMKSAPKSVVESDIGGYVMILDVSVSMLETVSDGQSKWEAAKKSASELITNVPDGLSLALVVYGHNKAKPCDVEILRPLAPINGEGKAALTRRIQQLEPSGNTPIGKSLQVAAEQVNNSRTPAKILLITDGIETCKGDPLGEATKFANSDIEGRTIDVIGFGLKPEEIESVSKIAENGKGKYFGAKDSQELSIAFELAEQELFQKLSKTEGAVKLASSKELTKPTELKVNTYTNARLSAGNSHYWKVDFQPGKYVLVYDMHTADYRYTGIHGSAHVGVNRGGEFFSEQRAEVIFNGVRGRNTLELQFSSPTTKIIQVHCAKSNSSLHDYHIGVFEKGTKFGVPYLVNSAEIRQMDLGKPTTSPQLGATPEFHSDNVVCYKVKLPAGDFVVDIKWTDGAGSDVNGIQRCAWVCNEYGIYKSNLVTGQSERDAKVKLQTADEQEVIMAFQAAKRNEKITVKITQVDQ